jgi:hypothetical protein
MVSWFYKKKKRRKNCKTGAGTGKMQRAKNSIKKKKFGNWLNPEAGQIG